MPAPLRPHCVVGAVLVENDQGVEEPDADDDERRGRNAKQVPGWRQQEQDRQHAQEHEEHGPAVGADQPGKEPEQAAADGGTFPDGERHPGAEGGCHGLAAAPVQEGRKGVTGDGGDGDRDDAPVLDACPVVGGADRNQGLERVESQGQDAEFLAAGPHDVGGAGIGVAVAGDVLLEHAAAEPDRKGQRAAKESNDSKNDGNHGRPDHQVEHVACLIRACSWCVCSVECGCEWTIQQRFPFPQNRPGQVPTCSRKGPGRRFGGTR